jgi:hypothetical protein
LEIFSKNTYAYENFIRICFDTAIRKNLHPIGIDIRKLLEFYEPYACNYVYESIREMSLEKDAVTLANVLRTLTDFVRWGNIRAYYIIELEDLFNEYYYMLEDPNCSFSSS